MGSPIDKYIDDMGIYKIYMDINFEYYKVFYCVARYGSITKAASALGGSQPNVTRMIKAFGSPAWLQAVCPGAKGNPAYGDRGAAVCPRPGRLGASDGRTGGDPGTGRGTWGDY